MGNKGAYVRFKGKDMEPKITSFLDCMTPLATFSSSLVMKFSGRCPDQPQCIVATCRLD